MRRSLFLVVSASTSLVMLGVLGWFKWSESATDRRLNDEIQKFVLNGLNLRSSPLRPEDIVVHLESQEPAAHGRQQVKGSIVIKRTAFSVVDPANGNKISFNPDGEVRAEFTAYPTLARESVSIAPWLGSVRPTWRLATLFIRADQQDFSLHGEKLLVPAWNRAAHDPHNAVFDAHLAFPSEFRGAHKMHDDAVLLVACRALLGLDRPEDAASLASSIGSRDVLEMVFDIDVQTWVNDTRRASNLAPKNSD